MKENYIKENKSKNELKGKSGETENKDFYGRMYDEAVPFTQINFQTFQNILDKRNELLNSVKINYNLKY